MNTLGLAEKIGAKGRSIVVGCVAIASVIALPSLAQAGSATVVSFDNGWYSESYYSWGNKDWTAGVNNINVGWNSVTGATQRNWLAFDLGAVTGQTITSATLTFYGGNGAYSSPKPSETLGLFDYTGSINALLNNQNNVGVYNDLGTGVSYGQATVSNPLGQFSITLSAAALAALNAAANNPSDDRFVIGGALLSIAAIRDGDNWYSDGQLFAAFGQTPSLQYAAFLSLETSDAAPGQTPIPGALPLFVSGLGAMGVFAYRRKKKALAA